MAEKSLFWNALEDSTKPTGYDRNYNADDISDWLDVIIPTGVVKNDTGLKVTAQSGMTVQVAAGKAVINGKPYRNDGVKTFTIDTAPTTSTPRIDLIVLQFNRDTPTRNTALIYKKGTGGTIPALVRTDLIFELALAKITVAQAVMEITQADIEDLRGDRDSIVRTTTGESLGYCPWVTPSKGYDDYFDAIVLEYRDVIKLPADSATVIFDIPQYGWTGVDILNVYTNGSLETKADYTVNENIITFPIAKEAGTRVEVVVQKFIDGEGLGTVLEQYQNLQTTVLKLANTSKYNYFCNGINDNIAISEIAQAFISGTYTESTITQAARDFLDLWGGVAGVAELALDANIKINVFGNFKATAPYAGAGTDLSGYQWLSLGRSTSSTKEIVFDFSACEKIFIPCKANAKNIIFYGNDVFIIGANVDARCYEAGAVVNFFSGRTGTIRAERCRFHGITTGEIKVAESGAFIDCYTWISTSTGNAACFIPVANSNIIKVFGGTHYAYTASLQQWSAVFYTSAGSTNAMIMAYGVSCPTEAVPSFYQTYCTYVSAGKVFIAGLATTLATNGASPALEILGKFGINRT